eukprot:104432-Chlamydomonas_euryale.AAC.1
MCCEPACQRCHEQLLRGFRDHLQCHAVCVRRQEQAQAVTEREQHVRVSNLRARDAHTGRRVAEQKLLQQQLLDQVHAVKEPNAGWAHLRASPWKREKLGGTGKT